MLLSFERSIASLFKVFDHVKYISLNNQPCTTGLTIINSNSNKNSKDLHYYPFLVKKMDFMESILLMISLIKYVFLIKQTT